MNKRAVENLIRAGAFDSMSVHRSQLIAVYKKKSWTASRTATA